MVGGQLLNNTWWGLGLPPTEGGPEACSLHPTSLQVGMRVFQAVRPMPAKLARTFCCSRLEFNSS